MEEDKAVREGGGSDFLTGENLLAMICAGLVNDACSKMLMSSFNYVFGMVRFIMLFEQFEIELKRLAIRCT